MCVGDFNEIGWAHEKYRGKNEPYNQMQDFCDILDECGFIDLGFVGSKFTWCKNYPDGSTIWEWLGGAVCNDEWL